MSLLPGTLEIWRVDLDSPTGGDDVLSSAEHERAERFRFDQDRVRWTRSRAVLRRLLARHLGCEPSDVEITSGPNGKPGLEGGRGLEFNLSHSGGVALIAFAIGSPVGVDVERVRSVRDPLGAARRVLGPDVLERLRSLAPAERGPEFLRAWVRYEAALKCRGSRLGALQDPGRLHMIDLDLGPDAAAVAVDRAPRAILLRDVESIPTGLVPSHA